MCMKYFASCFAFVAHMKCVYRSAFVSDNKKNNRA